TSPPSRFLSGCPRIYHPLSPICGSDGVTYPNKCAFCIGLNNYPSSVCRSV
uniref:Kazal-like domain-containing protein n=1 Tax=Naja naja TaxID=35670 RepID=A0A8C6VC56_NAJNA